MNRRNLILGSLLAASLALSAWTLLSPDDAVIEPVARPARQAGAGAVGSTGAARPQAQGGQATQSTVDLASRPPAPAAAHNLFSSYAYRPATQPPAEAAPVVPHAPALPFVYTGRLDIEGRTTYLFLQHGDTPIGATVGTPIGEFTLVEISGPNLVFVHGPTGERVTMSITSAFN